MRPVYLTLSDASGGAKSTPWQLANYNAQPFELTIAVAVTGTVDYDVQYTYDDIMGLPNPSSYSPTVPNPTVWTDPVLDGATASGETTFDNPIVAWRCTLNTGTGSLAIAAVQAGIIG